MYPPPSRSLPNVVLSLQETSAAAAHTFVHSAHTRTHKRENTCITQRASGHGSCCPASRPSGCLLCCSDLGETRKRGVATYPGTQSFLFGEKLVPATTSAPSSRYSAPLPRAVNSESMKIPHSIDRPRAALFPKTKHWMVPKRTSTFFVRVCLVCVDEIHFVSAFGNATCTHTYVPSATRLQHRCKVAL